MTVFEEMAVRNEERVTAAEKAMGAVIAEFQRSQETQRREAENSNKLLRRDVVVVAFANIIFTLVGPKALALVAFFLK